MGKSADELIDLLTRTYRFVRKTPLEVQYHALQAWGSFLTIHDANDLVSQALRANKRIVDSVVSGTRGQAVIIQRFGYPTGIEAYWTNPEPPPMIRSTFAVTVVIRSDPYSLRRYRVHTREFARYVLLVDAGQDDLAGQDAVVEEAYQRLSEEQKKEVYRYLDHLLSAGYSDRELWDIWSSSGSGIAFFPSPRWFFRRTLDMIARARKVQ